MIPIWASLVAVLLIPIALTLFAFGVAPAGRRRSYRLLFWITIAMCFAGLNGEVLLTVFMNEQTSGPLQAIAIGFVGMAVPDQLAKMAAPLVWLAFLKSRQPRDAIVGAVVTAMAYEAVENALFFYQTGSDAEAWLQNVLVRSLFTAPSSAVNGFIVGIFTALSLANGNRKYLMWVSSAFAVVLMTDGLWNTAFLLVSPYWNTPGLWGWIAEAGLPMVAASVALQASFILAGQRRLRRLGVSLRWPPSFEPTLA
jgi:hypothetical protein